MTLLSQFLTPPESTDWLGVAVRPGSGLGLLPAALSVQPAQTLTALLVTSLAAMLAPRLRRSRRGPLRLR